MILRYSRAFFAAAYCASFSEAPVPWQTATGTVEIWTKHWSCPAPPFNTPSPSYLRQAGRGPFCVRCGMGRKLVGRRLRSAKSWRRRRASWPPTVGSARPVPCSPTAATATARPRNAASRRSSSCFVEGSLRLPTLCKAGPSCSPPPLPLPLPPIPTHPTQRVQHSPTLPAR